ncbi:hypothetical protein J5F27_13325 [Schleiferilactobacillus harbinensis]|uniref:hypothetical protein n=1 Tax=Schleiferilactobacillus harbinensis TaxID=304207 RepID=UPI001AAECC8F|nr:hypothetical protein [Schleiferilactobacillus harbinensis]MBO3092888.1 hypothetical protein [Schleiferilactobacillus harbinensis]
MSELAGAVVVETSQLTLQLRTAAGLVVERLENTATGVMLGGARQPLFTIGVTWSAAGVRHVASTDLVVAQVTVPDHHHVHIVGTMLDSAFQVGVSLTVDAYGVLRGQVTLTTQEAGWQLVSIDWLPLPANPAAPTVWQHPDYDYPLTPYNATPQQIMLGQPVYVDSFFMGCEFPATDNRIADGLVLIRYYSGLVFAPGTPFSSPPLCWDRRQLVTWRRSARLSSSTLTELPSRCSSVCNTIPGMTTAWRLRKRVSQPRSPNFTGRLSPTTYHR